MKIVVANECGFCFGVKRAYELAIKNASNNTMIIGELVHNPDVQKKLYKSGIRLFDPENDKEGTLILKSHGTAKNKKDSLKKNFKLIDTTCPVLLNIYKKMQEYEKLGYGNIIIGDINHPEVIATMSQVENTTVIGTLEEARALIETTEKKYFVTIQTTFNDKLALQISNILKCKFGENIIIFNSICGASKKRRAALYELMNEVDCIIVLGGKNSNNTIELVNILKENNFPYFFINSINTLDLSSINMYNRIGITAGASTPDWIIKETVRVLNDINNKDSFDLGETR